MKTYKIIHPSHVRDWATVHAVGKTVRWVDPGMYGRGVVPPMDDADFSSGCVMLEVENEGFEDPVLQRVEAALPEFAAALLRYQADRGMNEVELIDTILKCCWIIQSERLGLFGKP